MRLRRGAVVAGALALLALIPDPRRRARRQPGIAAPPPSPLPARPPTPTRAAPAASATGGPGARIRAAAGLLRDALRRALRANVTDAAAALAYYAFLAIPAVLLVAVGVFGAVAGPGAIAEIVDRLDGVAPDEALTLIDDTLTRVTESSGGGLGLAVLGLVLALWTSSGAMTALMRGLNDAEGRREDRGFVRQRVTAVALLGWVLLAGLLSFGLLVLGAPLSRAVGAAVGAESAVAWAWWVAQWPILVLGLLAAVAGILRAGPAGPPPPSRLVSPGAVVAVAVWLAASGLFAFYVANFGNYGAAWGSLSAVIVMLTWLWLTSLAILLGAHVDAEARARAGEDDPA